MIRYIDDALQLWAAELHPPVPADTGFGGGGGNIIATLMATKGELIRSTRGSRVLLDRAAEIEHYTNYDSLDAQKWSACGCGRTQFYERLHSAHELIQAQLMRRAA